MSSSNAHLPVVYFLEDDEQIQSTVVALLELQFPQAIALRAFASLFELKQACAAAMPDLIISDLNVTDAGPVAVAAFLEGHTPPHIPVIFASGDVPAMQRLFDGQSRFTLFKKGDPPSVLLEWVEQRIHGLRVEHRAA